MSTTWFLSQYEASLSVTVDETAPRTVRTRSRSTSSRKAESPISGFVESSR